MLLKTEIKIKQLEETIETLKDEIDDLKRSNTISFYANVGANVRYNNGCMPLEIPISCSSYISVTKAVNLILDYLELEITTSPKKTFLKEKTT